MLKNSVSRNALLAIVQVLVTGIVLFLLYRYLLQVIGPEQVGIWALILATVSASRITEMGFAGSAVKYTARYIARGQLDEAALVIQTTVMTIGLILAVVLVVGYPAIVWVLERVLPELRIADGLGLLPYGLVSVWIGAMASIAMSGLDGCQRIDLRSMISIFGGVLLLILVWILVPRYGLIGLAWSQIGQGIFMMAVSWIILRQQLLTMPILPYQWRFTLFREMLRYGLNFQLISIAGMLFEPTTKVLMAKFGGLSATAYYEMANRMVTQFRALLVSANQVMVPRVAAMYENTPTTLQNTYLASYRIMFFLSVPLFAVVVTIAPLISQIWIGYYETHFVQYSILLAVGYCLNTLVGPAYFFNLGTGHLSWNVIGHFVIGVVNGSLGFILGMVFGGQGVVAGYVLALILGSGTILVGYHRDGHIPFIELFPVESRKLFLACLSGSLIGLMFYYYAPIRIDGSFVRTGVAVSICVLIVGPFLWHHPLQPALIGRFKAGLIA